MMAEAQDLIDALEDIGYDPEGYSGRGMYGKQCVSVRADDLHVLFEMGLEFGQRDPNEQWPTPRSDSLGTGIIIYWPRVEWPA